MLAVRYHIYACRHLNFRDRFGYVRFQWQILIDILATRWSNTFTIRAEMQGQTLGICSSQNLTHRIMPRVQATKILHHSGAIPEAALRPEGASSRELQRSQPSQSPLFRRHQLHTRQSHQQIMPVSIFSYVTTSHPWSPPSVTQSDFLHAHSVKRPPPLAVMD